MTENNTIQLLKMWILMERFYLLDEWLIFAGASYQTNQIQNLSL